MPLTVHTPTVAMQQPPRPVAPRGRPLEGQVWGFVDTSKVNADLFIEELRAEVGRAYGPRGFVVIRKPAPGLALTPEQIGRLAAECGFVIFCFGD